MRPDDDRRPYDPRIHGPRTRLIKPRRNSGLVQPGPPPGFDNQNFGLGNPLEYDYYYRGYRDPGQGEERPLDVVHDAKCPPRPPISRQKQAELDAFFCRQRQEFKRSVLFVKGPANVEPPWFAKPLIKVKNITVSAGATATIFDRVIEDRQRAVVSIIGIDVAPIGPYVNGQMEFWFAQGGTERQDVINLFDDQTSVAYGSTVPLVAGKTTLIPGSSENPFNLRGAGLQFRIKGRKLLTFNVENKSGQDVVVRGLMGMWIYWLPWGATEFESADVQL